MRSSLISVMVVLLATVAACSPREARQEVRGIADKRSDFRNFLPMTADPARDGLKAVKPFFRQPNRTEIMQAIERACDGRRTGSSVYEPRTGAGYYVNCNPRNRQLLNGYVPVSSSVQPHSR